MHGGLGGAEVASSNLVVPNFLSGLLDTGPDTDLECQRHGCQTEFPIINLGQIPGMLADRWTRALANSVGVYSAATASASCPLVRKFVCRVDLNISESATSNRSLRKCSFRVFDGQCALCTQEQS